MHKTMKVSCLYRPNSTKIPNTCNPNTCNTPFWVSKKCFRVNQLWLDTVKGIAIHVLGYFVLIHFFLHYQKGIARDQKDEVKLQYPSQSIPKMLSG